MLIENTVLDALHSMPVGELLCHCWSDDMPHCQGFPSPCRDPPNLGLASPAAFNGLQGGQGAARGLLYCNVRLEPIDYSILPCTVGKSRLSIELSLLLLQADQDLRLVVGYCSLGRKWLFVDMLLHFPHGSLPQIHIPWKKGFPPWLNK